MQTITDMTNNKKDQRSKFFRLNEKIADDFDARSRKLQFSVSLYQPFSFKW